MKENFEYHQLVAHHSNVAPGLYKFEKVVSKEQYEKTKGKEFGRPGSYTSRKIIKVKTN